MNKVLPKGTPAPDFTLRIGNGNSDDAPTNFFKLSDYKGKKNVVLAFYPADWSPVCSNEIALYNELLPEFIALNAEIVGISVDGNYCHAAFRKNNNLTITLLSDFYPHGEVAKKYGSFVDTQGFCARNNYVIDKNGVIQYSYESPLGEVPGAKELLDTLKTLQ